MKTLFTAILIIVFTPWLIVLVVQCAEVIEDFIAAHQVAAGASLIIGGFGGCYALARYLQRTDQNIF